MSLQLDLLNFTSNCKLFV